MAGARLPVSSESDALRILLVGSGRMGSAMLRGWLAETVTVPEAVVVVEPDRGQRSRIEREYRVRVTESAPVAWDGDAVVFAVKPQILERVLPEYRQWCATSCAISVAAGKDLDTISRGLGPSVPVVRAMPNLPAAIGHGVSVAVANRHVDGKARDYADRLLGAIGSVHWISDEALMDAVTALSGSGPAYVFLLAEAMAEAGREAGLPDGLARALALETVAGAGAMLAATDDDPASLRENVTSPGGTTEAGLRELTRDHRWSRLVVRAVAAAASRSRVLAQAETG